MGIDLLSWASPPGSSRAVDVEFNLGLRKNLLNFISAIINLLENGCHDERSGPLGSRSNRTAQVVRSEEC